MLNNKVLRVGLYERVSTDEQALRGYSIEAQIEDLEKFCKDKKYKIVGHYTDAGVSGGKSAKKRPGMSRLLEDVQAGKIDMILFTKLDRWFRNIQEYFKVQEILEQNRVEWKAIQEDYDTTTANGRMAITIFLAVAQNEREKGSERINVVFEHKRRNKEACFGGALCPLGYKKEKDKDGITRLVIDPETEEMTKEFWRIIKEDYSIMSAGRTVNLAFGFNRAYKEWLRMYHNELYRGEYKGVKDFCPAYITAEEWAECDAKRSIKRPQKKRVYLFTGMLICPVCGTIMSSTHKTNNGKEYYSYRCRHSGIRKCPNTKSVSEKVAEKWMLENMKQKLEEFIINTEVEEAAPTPKKKPCDVRKISERIRRLNVVYMAGGKTDDEYTEEMADLKRLLAEAEKEEVKTAPRDLNKLKEVLTSDFEAIYAPLTKEEKRQLWRSIVDTLEVEGNRIVKINFKA